MSLLPYAWAKAQRALLRPGEHGATLLVSPRTPGWAISEVRQRHGGGPRGGGRGPRHHPPRGRPRARTRRGPARGG
ncbi:hypothetical protein I5K72_24755, partial [Pseudomonas aeruginosa]|nr:hypothetical protein [Pseudomonas aeruginosa]